MKQGSDLIDENGQEKWQCCCSVRICSAEFICNALFDTLRKSYYKPGMGKLIFLTRKSEAGRLMHVVCVGPERFSTQNRCLPDETNYSMFIKVDGRR